MTLVAGLAIAGPVLADLFASLTAPGPGKLGRSFIITSGSENKSLEPIVMEFCDDAGVMCEVQYQGSLDIGMGVSQGQAVDAVWPANGIWIDLFDRARRVKHLASISRSPVILGVRRSKAEQLGWVDNPVKMADIVAAVESGDLRFLMTSATQSNSGAGAYLAMLAAMASGDRALTADDLNADAIQEEVRGLLRGVARTSGSSGWLRDLFLKSDAEGVRYDAMWNYEAILAETNRELRQRGAELLWAVYPEDGVAFADSPLGFVDREQPPEFEEFFLELQAYLLSERVQNQLVAADRRVALGRADAIAQPDESWNFDPTRFVNAIRMPEPDVVREALTLYQEALRRPSLTAYCLDFSGSMQGQGEADLKQAMSLLLRPERAREVLIQAGSRDRLMVIPFDNRPRQVWTGRGTEADQAQLLSRVNREVSGGGTDIYACAARALEEMQQIDDFENYLPAIVLMTDGASDGSLARVANVRTGVVSRVPIFGITFGNAERAQLDQLAVETSGRVFDGTKSLVRAFRTARGYN
ncbi:MAG: substrate-binding domain-containing protein [Alphaproteobacteria bacterium]|nr:substrate-binding domain-containing protein [Alphaproteobacteria bacterium SS10]